jgi:hypothetical protein
MPSFPCRLALSITTAAVALVTSGCRTESQPVAPLDPVPSVAELVAAAEREGLVRVTFPDPDPGIPSYARLTTIGNQILRDGDWVAIPFYRDPSRVPAGFNLLTMFDFPGPNGPGAFGAPLTISGFYLTERTATPGTFPRVAISSGRAVPVWFVPWAALREALRDNVVTMPELRALRPLEGTATQFEETLKPREGDHLLVITARGTVPDGRRFELAVAYRGLSGTPQVRLSLR